MTCQRCPYSAVRNLIQDGDYLLFAGNRLFSRLIQFYNRPWKSVKALLGLGEWPVSHFAFCVWQKVGRGAGSEYRLMVIESLEGPGVRNVHLSRYLKSCARDGVKVYWHRVTDVGIDRQGVVEAAFRELGEEYPPLWQLVWSFGWLCSWVRRRLGLREELAKDRPFCSQLGARCFKANGAQWLNPPTVSPEDAAGWKFAARECEVYWDAATAARGDDA